MAEGVVSFRPIGVIHSGHAEAGKTPIQPVFARGCRGRVEVFPEFAEGLDRIEGTRNGRQDAVDPETARERGRRGRRAGPQEGGA